jgi:hypothetical protein
MDLLWTEQAPKVQCRCSGENGQCKSGASVANRSTVRWTTLMSSITNTIRIATTIRTIRRLLFRGTNPSREHVFEFKRLNLQYLQVSARWADAATA